MKTIKLRNSDKEVMVDDEWYDRLCGEDWHIVGDRAGRMVLEGGKVRAILMHRVIKGDPDGLWVDHINGNVFDNRSANLRVCTPAQNAKNRGLSKRNTSGVPGVAYRKEYDRWVATIMCDGKKYSLGSYRDKGEAMSARREAELRLFGEFARMPPYLLVFDRFQEDARKYDIGSATCDKMLVHALGLAGEAGEVVELVKKHVRDDSPLDLSELTCELGDLFWYLTILADDFGLKMSDVADTNLRKLADRRRRNVLAGKGDHR